jgi:hypothetical protein
MPLPYYSDQEKSGELDFPYLLFFDDIKRTLGHVTTKDVGLIHPLQMRNIASYYYYAQQVYPNGALNWQRTAEVYFELIKLVAELGQLAKLAEIYFKSGFKINEGLQALYHAEDQLKTSKEQDWRVYTNALLHKYHTIYEGNIRASLVLAIFCLDVISNHEDHKQKSLEYYFEDDVSYDLKKIEKCKDFTFQHKLEYLCKGIEPHIRNAVGHKRIEYSDDKKVLLKDKSWNAEFTSAELERINQFILVNYYGQLTAQLLFEYDFKEKISLKGIRRYSNQKQLRILIDQEIRDSFFVTKDIRFETDESLIDCDVEKSIGFDHPSGTFVEYRGAVVSQERPGLDLEEYVLRVIHKIALLNTEFLKCRLNVYKYDETNFGSMTVDLKGAYEIARGDDGFNELKKRIISNTLVNERE